MSDTAQSSEPSRSFGPLAGLRVLELGQLIAGPFAAKTLADFGAEVVKIEPPGSGDPLRQWRMLHNGTSVWWQVQSRNKKSVTLDLRQAEARAIVRRLIDECDVLIENFKPGVMEAWGFDYDTLSAQHPGLIMLRISGYGQTGPYKDRPGFGVVAEAMGGLRHLTGEPGRVPVRVGVSIGDTLASLHGVIGILMALQHRHASVSEQAPEGRGQVIDMALYEAVFNCMESLLPEYSAFGTVRQAAGSALPGNGDSIFKRLMVAIGQTALAEDTGLFGNAARVARVDEIDAAIGDWTQTRSVEDVLQALTAAQVPAGRLYTAKDIAEDPHYRARGMLQRVTTHDDFSFDAPGIVPKLSVTPGAIARRAPTLGQDTEAVLRQIGVSAEQLAQLRERGIV
jgi:succinyl-CoA---D-citramalate CoA-transferase